MWCPLALPTSRRQRQPFAVIGHSAPNGPGDTAGDGASFPGHGRPEKDRDWMVRWDWNRARVWRNVEENGDEGKYRKKKLNVM